MTPVSFIRFSIRQSQCTACRAENALSSSPPFAAPEHRAIAASFVRARLQARALEDFPGRVPDTLEAAYACQDAAIAQWPDRLVGWKIGYIAPERRDAS